MEITETLYVTTRKDFRKWLEKNHNAKNEIWLIFYKKSSGKPRIPYDDAVEEALCFGWIDSTVKSVNEEYYVQRFTPRNKRSEWSLLNIQRMKKLLAMNAVSDAGLKTIQHLNLDKAEQEKLHEKNSETQIPAYLKTNMLQNKKSYQAFIRLSLSEQRNYIRWIEDAKKETTRTKRIAEMIIMLEKGMKLGMK